MCHRRGDWSRTSSRASESEEATNADRERASWVVRARERLAALVPTEEQVTGEQTVEERPKRPTIEAEGARASDIGEDRDGAENEETENEKTEDEEKEETEPIPADD